MYTGDSHWLVAQRGGARMALYSHRPMLWDRLRDEEKRRGAQQLGSKQNEIW